MSDPMVRVYRGKVLESTHNGDIAVVSQAGQVMHKLGNPERSSVRREAMETLSSAMRTHPHLVAGTERFCTGLMEAAKGAVLGKAGAEGVYCAGIIGKGLGICVKVDDGNPRAAYPAVVETLKQLHLVQDEVLNGLETFHQPVIRNHQGTLVGRIEPCFTLK